jgi:hypothetical protein
MTEAEIVTASTPDVVRASFLVMIVTMAQSTMASWCSGRRSYHRLHRRFGKQGGKKAATAHTLIVIIWHVLTENTAYRDLGSDYFTRRIDLNHPEARQHRLIRELEALGHEVTLEPTTA